jgi:hypothetical protein
MPHINLKDPKIVALIVGVVIVGYLLYRRYESSSSSTADSGLASTQGQSDASGLDSDGSGGGWDGGGGSGSTGTGDLGDGSDGTGGTIGGDFATLGSEITGLQSAIQTLTPTTPTSTSTSATGGGTALTGSLAGMPKAVQIALVDAGLATASQLGPDAAKDYAAGDRLGVLGKNQRVAAKPKKKSKAADTVKKTTLRAVSAAVGNAAHAQATRQHSTGHSSHPAGNAAHAQRSHIVTPHAVPAPVHHAAPAPPPRPAQKHKRAA